ncbi:hypothetical protein [Bradyrhizobium sp. JYMT SZCCT0428]|nr:hypothetical protein [Bradyrhizobium sp. JYMT SZCCT0428]MBR1156109.1 hypothetical protein [Bradyrhizobium sp. JYMT SZCCT0428]
MPLGASYLSCTSTEADDQQWGDQRDWTARKYALMDRGEKVHSDEIH